jgi:hypothetical protein
MSRRRTCASFTIRSLPHRPHVIRMNHDGNAERLVEGLLPARQRIVAVAAPVAFESMTICGVPRPGCPVGGNLAG